MSVTSPGGSSTVPVLPMKTPFEPPSCGWSTRMCASTHWMVYAVAASEPQSVIPVPAQPGIDGSSTQGDGVVSLLADGLGFFSAGQMYGSTSHRVWPLGSTPVSGLASAYPNGLALA